MSVLSPIQPARASPAPAHTVARLLWQPGGCWASGLVSVAAHTPHISPAHWVAAAAPRQSPSCRMQPPTRLESSVNACPRSSCDITLSSVHVPALHTAHTAYAVRSAPPSPHLPPPAPCLVPMGSLPPHHRECSLPRLHTARSAHYCECPLLRVLTTETPRACEAPPPRP